MIIKAFFAQVTRKRLVLFGSVRVDDMDMEVFFQLEALAAVLAQMVVKGCMNVSMMFLLLKHTKMNEQL